MDNIETCVRMDVNMFSALEQISLLLLNIWFIFVL